MQSRKYLLDIAMTALLPMLMAYSLIGETFHEIAGTAMLALFLCHHWLNRQWFKGLFKGRYTPQRVFRTVVDILLLIVMILQPLSGIVLSKHLFSHLPFHGLTASARTVHLVLGYWGFVLMSLHTGTHLGGVLSKGRLSAALTVLKVIGIVVSAYGCFAFLKRQIPDYLFLRSAFVFFDFGEPRMFFFLDYLSIMMLFAVLGHWTVAGLQHIPRQQS